MSSRSSAETAMTCTRAGIRAAASDRTYSVRMATTPGMRISCAIPAGIQTARCGGTAQLPLSVLTSITPAAAKMSWARGWRCRAMC